MTRSKEKIVRKNIHLTFPPEHSDKPIVAELVKQFDVDFSIVQAKITPRREGFLTLLVDGSEENLERALLYLEKQGIAVSLISQRITREETLCMQCGMCTAICPPNALYNDRTSRLVGFDAERCIACGQCIRICPVAAMRVAFDS